MEMTFVRANFVIIFFVLIYEEHNVLYENRVQGTKLVNFIKKSKFIFDCQKN